MNHKSCASRPPLQRLVRLPLSEWPKPFAKMIWRSLQKRAVRESFMQKLMATHLGRVIAFIRLRFHSFNQCIFTELHYLCYFTVEPSICPMHSLHFII